MSVKLTEKTTIYLSPTVKRFLQLKSLQKSQTMSRLINDQLTQQLREFEEQKDHTWSKLDENKEWNWFKSKS